MVNDYILNLKKQAIDKKIPIIQDDVGKFLMSFIREHNIKSIFEIGTASSYSAHIMASAGATIHTIERNKDMFELAVNNIQLSPLKEHIKLINDDAITFETNHQYDMIFIDGAKSQYKHFFETFQKNLKPNGMIVCDNIFFHHLKEEEVSRNTKHLLRKIKAFKQYLMHHPMFETQFLSIGDGLSLSRKKS
jgi:predicted O-methyltransferase YrrM